MATFNLSRLLKTADRPMERNSARLVALLENARDLVVIRQQRPQASAVVLHAAEFAKSIRKEALSENLLTLATVVKGKNSWELNEWFDNACQDVLANFR